MKALLVTGLAALGVFALMALATGVMIYQAWVRCTARRKALVERVKEKARW